MTDSKPVFDCSRSGERTLSQRHDQVGEESGIYANDGQNDSAETGNKPGHMREDQGWRPGEQPIDPGKIYTTAEIAAAYPEGYVQGIGSLHFPDKGETGYQFPEARPRRICG